MTTTATAVFTPEHAALLERFPATVAYHVLREEIAPAVQEYRDTCMALAEVSTKDEIIMAAVREEIRISLPKTAKKGDLMRALVNGQVSNYRRSLLAERLEAARAESRPLETAYHALFDTVDTLRRSLVQVRQQAADALERLGKGYNVGGGIGGVLNANSIFDVERNGAALNLQVTSAFAAGLIESEIQAVLRGEGSRYRFDIDALVSDALDTLSTAMEQIDQERTQISQHLTALSCMRRSGETPETLAKRDAEMAALQERLAAL